MKICIVSPFAYGINVSPRLHQAMLLNKRGHKVFFVTPRQQYMTRYYSRTSTIINNILLNDIGVYYFNAIYPVADLAYPFPNLLEELNLLDEIIKRYKIDIMHFYQPEFLTSLPLPFIKKKYNIPILLTINGFPGISWYYGQGIVDFIGLTYSQTIVRLLMMCADRILVYATNLKQYAKKLGVPEEKIIFLPEGVDTTMFQNISKDRNTLRKELGIAPNEKLIIFVGRLVPVKKVDLLIRVFKRLYSRYPDCKLIIVGDGPYREIYHTLSGELLGKSIIFIGLVKPEKVRELLLSSDIFVLPSLSEGIPSSLLEACLCGLPCIATDVGAIPDIIENGRTGLIIPPNSTEALTRALTLLIENDSLAIEMGKRAAERVKNLFNWDIIVKRYERICDELLR